MSDQPKNKKSEKVTQSAGECLSAVMSQVPYFADLINEACKVRAACLSGNMRSKKLPVKAHSQPYIVLLAERGINRRFVLNFKRVNQFTYREFIQFPIDWITLTDLLLVESATGVSVAKQVQVLLYGLTERDARPQSSVLPNDITTLEGLDSPASR